MKSESTFRVKQCDIMEEMNVYFSLGLVSLLVLSSHAMSDPPILQLCHVGEARSDHADINMNNSLIVGTNGSCSCHFHMNKSAELELSFENVTAPKCERLVTLSDPDFQTTCNDGCLQSKTFHKVFKNEGGSWINVKTIESFTHPISGTIKLRTKHDFIIYLRCYEPNISSQPMSNQTTAPLPTSTTSTSSTTTIRTTSALTSVRKTTTKLMSSTVPTSTKPVLSTNERGDVSTRSNTTAPDPGGNALQVILSCVAGSVVAVGVILLAVFCYRRKKRRDKRTMTNETSSIQRDDKQNDVTLSMENKLYCSADEMSTSSKVNQGESSEGTEMDEKKTSSVIASNGDVYAVVDRSLKISVI